MTRPMTGGVARRVMLLAAATLPFALGGCLATRNDLRLVQQDLAVMRAEGARADSARMVQLQAAIASLAQVSDSLRALATRMSRFQGDALGRLASIEEQLLTVQELTGQSQRRLQELRAQMESRTEGVPIPPTGPTPVVKGDTAVGSAPAAAGPGPNQLFQLALDQLRRGSAGAARAGFEDLLRQYPNADVASESQFYVAESYAAEGKVDAADSVYVLTATRYPSAPRAATALYKHALSLQTRGRTREARTALDEVIRRFPRSDEAVLARDRLRTLR